ncbi:MULTISPECIES: ISAs1 family transposase [unclassified Microcoleus]|uniref:ISAs1 family transposase n=1 Tax=unclassified Microcoleus TaxID=2642155 RepID=UPI002FCF4C62
MQSVQKKTAPAIVDSGNDYIGALKGNQSGLLEAVQSNFQAIQTHESNNVGHGRVEKRRVSISNQLDNIPEFPGLKTVIRIESYREFHRANIIESSVEIRFYVSSLIEKAEEFAKRIRGYWGVENKVHYVRNVTKGEDASRIRTKPLVQIWAAARNFARSHIPRLWI